MVFSPRKRGFTRTEVVVMIAILGILIALLLPAIQATREASRRAACIDTLKQIGIALHYHHDSRKRFPGSNSTPFRAPDVGHQIWTGPHDVDSVITSGTRGQDNCRVLSGSNFSWLVMLRPFLEEGHLGHDPVNITSAYAWDATINTTTRQDHSTAWRTPIPSVKCASFPDGDFSIDNPSIHAVSPYTTENSYGPAAITNYVALGATHLASLWDLPGRTMYEGGKQHPNGTIFPGSKTGFRDMLDGASSTLVICETREVTLAAWYDGATAAVVGLAQDTVAKGGFHSLASTIIKGMDFGAPPPGAKTTLNYGNVAKRSFYLQEPPNLGTPWLHGPSSYHPGVVNHLFADGSVTSVSNKIDPSIYMRVITRAGNDPISEYTEDCQLE